METCRYHTPHQNTLDKPGYERGESYPYASPVAACVCSHKLMQQEGRAAGCAYAFDQSSCELYEPDRQVLAIATNDNGMIVELVRARLFEGSVSFFVTVDRAIQPEEVFSVFTYGEQAEERATQAFTQRAEQANAQVKQIEQPDEVKTSYLKKVTTA